MHSPTRVRALRFGRLIGCFFALGHAAACSGGRATATETIQNEATSGSIVAQLPGPVRDKLSEELGRMPLHEVEDEGAGIRLTVEAPEPPAIEPVEGEESMRFFRVRIPEAIIECYLYGDVIDPASTMENFFVLAAGESSDWYAIDELGAAAVDGRPYLYGTAITRVRDGDTNLWGNFHVAVGQAQYDSLACIANGPGRRQTFRRIFERMLRTLESQATTVPEGLVYHSIARCVSTEGSVAMYADIYVYDEETDETLAEIYESTIYRGQELHLIGSDSYELIRSQNGWITGARYTEATRETLEHDLVLSAVDGATGEYKVTGTLMDKAYEARIDSGRGIADVRRNAKTASDFARKKSAKVVSIASYEPGVDPSGTVDMMIERKEDTDEGVVSRVTMANMSYSAVIDRNGELKSFVMPMFGAQLSCEQVWIEGALVD